MRDPIETTTRKVTTVDDITEAWAFVMEHIDAAGGRPHVEIRPITIFSIEEVANQEGSGRQRFEVVVEGREQEEA